MITDIVLPGGMDGTAIAKAARVADPDLPVLFMSGYARESQLGAGAELDDARYLNKPFAPDQLYAKVREILDGKRPA